MNTQILKHGEAARLFPTLPDSQKEQKTLSILLGVLTSVKPFSDRFLSIIEQKAGKRSVISCYTEVTLTNEIKGSKDRPDALIVLKSGQKSWSALIEAKVNKNEVVSDQLERYLQLAKMNGIDAVITLTNQLTPAPRIHPTKSKKAIPKGVDLFHISWASIITQAFLLAADKNDPFENDDEAYIISELIRYLEHPSSGVTALSQMHREWPNIVKAIQSGHPPNPKSTDVSEMVTTWHQEARDVALILTRKLSEPVTLNVSRTFLLNHQAWIEAEIKQFCEKNILDFELEVPNTAGKIVVEADFLRRAVRVSMKVTAPTDKVKNSARLNWLLRQLKGSDLSTISILCITKGRGGRFGAMAHEIDLDTDEFKSLGEITSFNVEMSSDLSSKFNSRKKFVEELEQLVPAFYKNVGQNIKAWAPSPPKVTTDANKTNEALPELSSQEVESDIETSNPQTSIAIATPRPEWTKQWSVGISPQNYTE